MIKLIAADGDRTYNWELAPGEYQIGRNSDRDIHIPNRTISRLHAVLVVSDNGMVTVADQSSHNGSSVAGKQIGSTPVTVDPGDEIYFGEVACQLIDDSAPQRQTNATVSRALLADFDPEHSVAISIHEALKPLPTKVAEIPELLPTLFDMAKALSLNDPQEEMLNNSLDLIARVVPADRLAVLFREEGENGTQGHSSDTKRLSGVYTAALRLPGGKDPGAFKISSAIVESIFTDKNAILIGNPKDDPRFAARESIIMSEITSALAVPLFDEGEALGILYLDTANPFHHYGNEHLRLVSMFGNIIAARIRNTNLLEERQQKRLMDAEMDRAASIQKRLLRSEFPTSENIESFAFQEPSRQVGGDLYDLFPLPDGRTVFLVADVSGKGMGAALLMTNILSSFRILYERGETNLLENIIEISNQLFRYSGSTDFATLFAGIISADGSEITYLNAGHNPPYLVRKDGSIEELPASGVMIGAFPDCQWEETKISFNAGDTLFIFSDGVTEAETADGDQYEEPRLERFLKTNHANSAKQITELLLSEIREFVGDAPQSDDITTLTIQRKDA
ncbi:SpoIIE family protein phosphatase [Gemmatimonas aurantiaca]|nr:SpoIIE family protein phosphatase [Gemmatimonas aurantiaca]